MLDKTSLNDDGLRTEKDTLLIEHNVVWEAFYCIDEDDPEMAQILIETIDARFVLRLRLADRAAVGYLFGDLLDGIEGVKIEQE